MRMCAQVMYKWSFSLAHASAYEKYLDDDLAANVCSTNSGSAPAEASSAAGVNINWSNIQLFRWLCKKIRVDMIYEKAF